MSRFGCIGPSCEATCCEFWSVEVDRPHYERMKQATSKTPQGRQEFGARVKRVKGPTGSKSHYALMVMNEGANRACGYFTPARLCGLQERHGEEVLGDTCAQYPRLISRSGARWEMAGSTSCPEVARQLLLHADALELDEIAPDKLSRRKVEHQLPAQPSDPYTRYHDELRNLILDVLSDPRFDLGTRLAMVAYFAERTRPFLYRGVAQLDEARLHAEVERILDPGQRAALAHEFAGLAPPASLAVRLVLAFLVWPVPQPWYEPLRVAVLGAYLPEMTSVRAQADFERAGEEIILRYGERKRKLHKFAARIDQSLTNYAKSFWVREWYFTSPDLLTHTMELLVLLSAMRLLLLGHPLLAEIEAMPEAAQNERLDRAIVDTVFRFSRRFEHAHALLAKLRSDIQEKQLVTLAHAVSLALF